MRHCPLFSRVLKGVAVAALSGLLATGTALAQKPGTVVIRDAEIEGILKEWALPVIKAAELNPDAVKIILVQDSQVNAFVAGGQNVFLYTGLLQKSENPGEILGVIAHELGHISGGHLVGARGAMQNASYESILGTILGIGAAVLTGEGGVGAAVAAGTQSSAMGRYLAFSRVQESSADQAAMSAMERAGLNSAGLISFMHKMESNELLPASQQTPWARTHPLARERIEALESGHARSAFKAAPYPAEWQEQYDRVMAKLTGFIAPERVAWDYDSRDRSLAADYARTVAAYRQNRVAEALNGVDALLAREQDNPFFLELKGQMLADFGRVEESLAPYRRAIELYPQSPLIRTAYGNALIETSAKDPARLDEAIKQLERAMRDDPRVSRVYRLLATAYGRKGQEPTAKLYLAEEALLKGERDYAQRQAEAALAGLPPGSQGALRAQDILAFVDQAEKNAKN